MFKTGQLAEYIGGSEFLDFIGFKVGQAYRVRRPNFSWSHITPTKMLFLMTEGYEYIMLVDDKGEPNVRHSVYFKVRSNDGSGQSQTNSDSVHR